MTTSALSDVLALIAEQTGPHLTAYLPSSAAEGESLAFRLSKRFQDGPNDWSGWYNLETAGLALARHPRAIREPNGMVERDGVGVFLADGFTRVVPLPGGAPDRVVGGSCFFVKPVLAATQSDGEFHLLTLSRRQAQLFRGSADRLTPVTAAHMPTGIDDPSLAQEHGKSHTLHTVGSPHGRKVEAVFHGHSSGPSDEKHDLEQYLRRVEQAVTAALRHDTAPLLLAGVGEQQALYRRLNRHPHLLDEGVGGSPDHRSAAELHREAWPLVCAARPRPADAAIRQYEQLRGTGRTADTIEEVVLAATVGEIGTLLVSTNRNVWGRFDPARRAVTVHPAREPGDDELTNLAAVNTLRHGGVVYTVAAEELGDHDALGLRWLPVDKHGKGGPS